MTEAESALVALAGLCCIILALPHLLPLHRVSPAAAGRVWLLALAVRALLSLGIVVAALVWIPHISALAPAVAVGCSLTIFVCVLTTVTVRLRRRVSELALGDGPEGSLVIADRDVYVALTGVGPARVLVSAGALDVLDGPELRASLAHEHGHRHLGHRALTLAGATCLALARPLPAGAACRRGLRLSLERHADEYAVHRTGDPLALASAICKAAQGRTPVGSLALARSGTAIRLDQLIAGGFSRGSALSELATTALATMLCAVGAALAVAVGWVLATEAVPLLS